MFANMLGYVTDARIEALERKIRDMEKEILDLKAKVDSQALVIRTKDVQIAIQAEVIERERARVAAETAIHALKQAEAESGRSG